VNIRSEIQRSELPSFVDWVRRTYAPGQMLVKMKSGMLDKALGGFDGPSADVMVKATSSEM
jgi:hypothetical protein